MKLKLYIVAAMMLALSLASCNVAKHIKTKEVTLTHRDSIHVQYESRIDTTYIAERRDSASIRLEKLIRDGYFNQRNNGVQTIIKYKDDTLHAECICDEIEHLVISTIERYFEKSSQKGSAVIVEEKIVIKRDWNTIFLLLGIITFLISVIILIVKYGKAKIF